MNSFLYLSIFISFILFTSCSNKEYELNIVCTKNEAGDYIIKWETFPQIPGNVKIYKSDNPDNFSGKPIEMELPVQDGVAILKDDKYPRSYFKLVFEKNTQAITSSRSIDTDNIVNLRGLGGYFDQFNKQVKWGKLYRSGSLSNASQSDIKLLKALNIKTAIDLRTDEEIALKPTSYFLTQTFRLPLRGFDPELYAKKIINGEMKKGDAFILRQDLHAALIDNNTDYFKRYFEILSDSSNYPIIVYCAFGKDRAGIIAALTLSVLGIDEHQIYDDYMLSNSHINFNNIIKKADTLCYEKQEALTMLLSSQRQTIEYTKKRIEKQYGSLENYFEKELKLTNEKREKIKDLLVYQNNN